MSPKYSRIRTPPRGRTRVSKRTIQKVLRFSRKRGLFAGPRPAKRLRTMTKTKVAQRAKPLPNRSGSESKYDIFLKPKGLMPKFASKLQSSTYTYNVGVQKTWAVGKQDASTLTSIYNVPDLQAMFTSAYRDNADAVGDATTKIFCKSCFSEVQIQNSSNAVARVIIWNLLPKRDIYQNDNAAAGIPENLWSRGLKEQTSSGTGTEFQNVGSRPTDAKMFNDYWKVKKVTYVDLAPGQVHYHRMHYKINRFCANEMVAASNLVSLKGWELATMLQYYGEPVSDSVTGATTEAGKLNVVVTKTYHFDWVKGDYSYSSSSANLLGTAAANLENLVTGAAAAYSAT